VRIGKLWFSALKHLGNGESHGESYYRPLTATHISDFDWYHVRWPWMTFEGHFRLCCHWHVRYLGNHIRYVGHPVADYTLASAIIFRWFQYYLRPRKLKLLIKKHTRAFRWYGCRWPWRYFKVIRSFHINELVSFLYLVENRNLPRRFRNWNISCWLSRNVWCCWNSCCWLTSNFSWLANNLFMSLSSLLISPPSLQVVLTVADWPSTLWEDTTNSSSSNQPVVMVICDTQTCYQS